LVFVFAIFFSFTLSLHADSGELTFEEQFKHLLYFLRETKGSQAIVDRIEMMSKNSTDRLFLQKLQARDGTLTIRASIHPHEEASLRWLNQRFERMGLSKLEFDSEINSDLPDPHIANPKQIQKWKWFRYAAGPGVAVLAMAQQMRSLHADRTIDYFVMMIPAAAMGLTTIVLEWQFAHPTMNAKVWAPFFSKGGPLIGRAKNWSINVLYGMTLWSAGQIAIWSPQLFGEPSLKFNSPDFLSALTAAVIGGSLFTIAMGQYQTDLSLENQSRGSIQTKRRYMNESVGVGINNGARVGGWIVPGYLDKIAYAVFFALKTWPQLIKTNISPALQDLEIQRNLFPDTAPKKNIL
jgi:hypothetical protein